MAEASVFIGLTASVATEYQAIVISGLFLAGSIGVISGLAASSAIAEVSLKMELNKGLSDYPDKEKASLSISAWLLTIPFSNMITDH